MVEHVHSATVSPRRADDGPDPVEAVDPDPGAVFDANDAETVDELVASGSGAEAPTEPLLEADDEDVAALVADAAAEREADSGSSTGRASSGSASSHGNTASSGSATPPGSASSSGSASSTAPGLEDDAGPNDDLEALLPERGADVLAELEDDAGSERDRRAERDGSDARGADDAPAAAEATDADVAAALDAAEDVYEGDLPEEIPFE